MDTIFNIPSNEGRMVSVAVNTEAPIQLLSNQVLLKLKEPETRSNYIIFPEIYRDNKERTELYRGTVIAVGPGGRTKSGKRVPCDVRPGDDVQFYWLSGVADVTQWPDSDHRIIREDQIQCVMQ